MIQDKIFFNQTFDKTRLKVLILWYLTKYGDNLTINFIENLKNIGFFYATKAGLSLSIEDLKIPPSKSNLIVETERLITIANLNNQNSKTTPVEYFQNIIDLWYKTSELIRYNVIQHFNKIDKLNPVFMMAFSGARGNISQVRQLVGMRGLMADPEGQILNFPIRSNFREGLSLTEYIISCYGARKGLVDTALKTANSGYLTRRLVDVAQHIIISQYDCETKQGIYIGPSINNNQILISLEKKLVGRVLAEQIPNIAKKNQIITIRLSIELTKKRQKIFVRSPLSCNLKNSICQLCYGWNLSTNSLVALGECVGILAAQSIGEPGTQLTMRTFHTGGVFSGDVMEEIRSLHSGKIFFTEFIFGTLIRTLHGNIAFLTKNESKFILNNKTLNKKTTYSIPKSTILFVKKNQFVKENQLLAEYSFLLNIKNNEIQTKYDMRSNHEGEIFFENIFLLQNKISNNFRIGLNFGTFWILEGKIYQAELQSNFFTKKGDLIDSKSIILQLDKNFSYSSELFLENQKIKNFKTYKKKFQSLSNKKKIAVYKYLGNLKITNFIYKKIGYYIHLKNLSLYLLYSKIIQEKNDFRFFFFKLFFVKNQKYFLFYSKKQIFKDSFFSIKKTIFLLEKEKLTNYISLTKILNKSNTKFNIFKSNKTCIQFYFFKTKQTNFSIKYKKNSLLEKNPQQQILKKKFYLSIVYSKSSKKLQKQTINKNIILKNNSFKNLKNYKITIHNGWFFFYSNFPICSNNLNQNFFLIRTSENFFNSKFIYKESINLSFKINYFSLFKFLNIRKFLKNNKFYYKQKKYRISRNFQIFKNLKQKNEKFLIYKKMKENNFRYQVKKQKLFQTIFENRKYIELFNFKNPTINQQTLCKIKNNVSKLQIKNKNTITLYNSKIISKNIFLKFDSKVQPNTNFAITYSFPKVLKFYNKKVIDEKKISHIKKNLKLINNKISEHSFFYRYSICSGLEGEITKLKTYALAKEKALFLTKTEKKAYSKINSSRSLFLGKVLRIGDQLNNFYASKHSGQIIEKTTDKLIIRKAYPYLFSTQSIFHINHSDLVSKNNLLLTLFYQKLKNEDIIQGIPKIEELFEARNLKNLEKRRENIHFKLELCFQYYRKIYTIEKALQKSIKTIQQILVHNIQKVYEEQGVFIADKHIEIIIRQMTTKVFITESGKTGLLQGELIDIKYIDSIHLGNNFKQIYYQPIILGITKASLETDSFISAASFQETTRILSNGVIEQKTDFLRGLKENVIVGHLIPGGTGYHLFSF